MKSIKQAIIKANSKLNLYVYKAAKKGTRDLDYYHMTASAYVTKSQTRRILTKLTLQVLIPK